MSYYVSSAHFGFEAIPLINNRHISRKLYWISTTPNFHSGTVNGGLCLVRIT